MADDDPAVNSGLNLSYINLYAKFFSYREQCQSHLARLAMLPSDYYRYVQLAGDLVNGYLPYTEFSRQMNGDLLLRNPNYAHLRVYWADQDRFCNEGIPVVASPLFIFPIIRYAGMGLPIAPDDLAQFMYLGSQLWNLGNQIPEQSRIPIAQQVRNWQYAFHQELDRHHEHYRQYCRQQEYYRQQEMALRQQEHYRQQEMALRQRQEHYRQQEMVEREQRREKNRGYRKTYVEKKQRLEREREQDPESSTDSSIDRDDDGA